MLTKNIIFFIVFSLSFSVRSLCEDTHRNVSFSEYQEIGDSYKSFYSWKNLAYLGIGLGIGAVFANTKMDQNINDNYQNHVRTSATDRWSHIAKSFGEPYFILSYPLGALSGYLIGKNSSGNFIWNWAKVSSIGILTGAPMLLFWQRFLGATRPNKENPHSHYAPFTHDDAVSLSGHAFMGAIPFLSLAVMSEHILIKSLCYSLSTVTAWSRLNDKKHYFSQICLGWFTAYLSINSSSQAAQNKSSEFAMAPWKTKGISFYYIKKI